jgi:23S rRNA-intervening sequence protein
VATFQTFEEIESWQMARRLTFEIYGASKKSPFAKDFGLQKQIRDASVSVMANIAEDSKGAVLENSNSSWLLLKDPQAK